MSAKLGSHSSSQAEDYNNPSLNEALAATAPSKSPVDTFARFEKRGPGMTDWRQLWMKR